MVQKIVLVTGASRGIGFAIAKAFAQEGYKCILNYVRNQEACNQAIKELNNKSNCAIAIQADVSQKVERESLVNRSLEAYGRIDVLVNNAAVATELSFLKTNEEEFDRLYDCNVKAPVFLTKLVASHMIQEKIAGSIINIASIAGHTPMGINYGGSKAALLMETKNMARKLAPYNIRVNSISPGTTKTDLNKKHWENNTKVWQEQISTNIPLKRVASPNEIAQLALFLASDKASFVSGADLLADGGQSTAFIR